MRWPTEPRPSRAATLCSCVSSSRSVCDSAATGKSAAWLHAATRVFWQPHALQTPRPGGLSDLRERLRDFAPAGHGDADAGAHYKAAEMSIARKADDPHPEFSLFLVTLFGIAASLLKPRKGGTIVDT